MPPTPPESHLVVARQAGSAIALAPVIRQLRDEGCAVVALALGAAQGPWADLEIDAIPVAALHDALPHISAHGPVKSVLTGTSLAVAEDAAFWSWASQAGVPSVAFIDSWCNYAARFRVADDAPFVPWPDVVAVIDDLARRGAEAEGLPSDRLVCTGSPAFDDLAQHRVAPPSLDAGPQLLFVSQPLAGRGLPPAWDEWLALRHLVEAARGLGPWPRPARVTIRPHPAEAEAKFDAFCAAESGPDLVVEVNATGDRHAWVAASHVVVGVGTTLLVEAQLIGRPVLSVQGEPPAPIDIIEGHGVPIARDVATVRDHLTRALEPAETWRPPTTPLGDATERLVALLRRLAAGHP